MLSRELSLGGGREPGAMVDLADGLKWPGNSELFLGGSSHAIDERPNKAKMLQPTTQKI